MTFTNGAFAVGRAMLLIALLKLALAIGGFERTWSWIRRRAQVIEVAADVETTTVERLEHTVAMAAALYPGRAQCLERSLLLYWCLRRRGIVAHYRMGVQSYPFLAHAWIEYRGHPINDVPEHVRRFRPIEGLAS